MPNFTPGFGLPYPSSTDEPCDFAEQWCDFTQALDAVFDGFQETLNRTVPVIPIAMLRVQGLTTPDIAVPQNSYISYNNLVMDTAGWTDLEVDSTIISPDMAGILSYSSANLMTQQEAPGMMVVDVGDSSGVLFQPLGVHYDNEMDMNTAAVGIVIEQVTFVSPGHWIAGVTGIRNQLYSDAAPFPIGLQYGYFTIYWHADGGMV